MALAKFRKVSNKIGNGRFVVSEGVAPSAYLLPHEALPTIAVDEEDDRFEIVVPKGCILSAVQITALGDTRLVPCGYAGTPAGTDVTNVALPVGCAQYNLYRPFDKGTSQGAGWITHGYVEWPMISGVNDTFLPGGLVVSGTGATAGVPVPAGLTPAVGTIVGRVIEVETLGGNYDSGLLEYLRLTGDAAHMSDPLFNVSNLGPNGEEGVHHNYAGIRGNLDVYNVVGAVRVALTI